MLCVGFGEVDTESNLGFVLSLANTSLSASIELFHESTQRSPKEREVWSLSAPNITDDRSRRVGRETIKKTHFMFLCYFGGHLLP